MHLACLQKVELSAAVIRWVSDSAQDHVDICACESKEAVLSKEGEISSTGVLY